MFRKWLKTGNHQCLIGGFAFLNWVRLVILVFLKKGRLATDPPSPGASEDRSFTPERGDDGNDRSFITRDFNRGWGKENGTIPFYGRFSDDITRATVDDRYQGLNCSEAGWSRDSICSAAFGIFHRFACMAWIQHDYFTSSEARVFAPKAPFNRETRWA
jgi:hypothetical protein